MAGALASLLLCAAPAALAQGTTGPVQRPAPPQAAPAVAEDDAAARVGDALPLPPAVRNLRDQLPPDPRGTARQLGLREPTGTATDLRNRTPSPREISDALAPR